MVTMNERYGDGSNHEVCDQCGRCIPCGDCQCNCSVIPEPPVVHLLTPTDDGLCCGNPIWSAEAVTKNRKIVTCIDCLRK